MVEIVALNILESSQLKQLIHLLTKEKLEKWSRIKDPSTARRFLASDLLARAMICDRLGWNNQCIQFGYNDYGKPFLKESGDFHFNISHAGDWVVMAMSQFEVGVDIENIVPLDIEIARRFFSSYEYQQLKKIPPALQLDHFFQIWTLKESYSKMIGSGLALDMTSFSIVLGTESEAPYLSPVGLSPIFFKQYDFIRDYKLSVCSRDSSFSPNIIQIAEDTLLDRLLPHF